MASENIVPFRDVHVYDGKWSHDIKTEVSIQEKCELFNSLYQEIKTIGNGVDVSSALKGLVLVVENTQRPSNFDPANNIYADDILVEICKMITIDKLVTTKVGTSLDESRPELSEKMYDSLMNVAEQLGDMYNLGQCPQGRSTRLIQIYN